MKRGGDENEAVYQNAYQIIINSFTRLIWRASQPHFRNREIKKSAELRIQSPVTLLKGFKTGG